MNENEMNEVTTEETTSFPVEGDFDQDEKGNDLLGAVIIGAIGFVGGVVVDKIATTIKNKKAEKADGAEPKEKVGLIGKIKGAFGKKKDSKDVVLTGEVVDEEDSWED